MVDPFGLLQSGPVRRVAGRVVMAAGLLGGLLMQGACKDQGSTGKAEAIGVGFRTSQMNYYAARQAKSNWCWAACVQMVLSTKGIEQPQEAIVRRAFGEALDIPGSVEMMARNLDGWVLSHGSRRYRLVSLVGIGRPPDALLVEQLQKQSAVIVCMPGQDGSVGHAVVISAAVCRRKDNVLYVESVLVRDPNPGLAPDRQKRKLAADELQAVAGYMIITEVPL